MLSHNLFFPLGLHRPRQQNLVGASEAWRLQKEEKQGQCRKKTTYYHGLFTYGDLAASMRWTNLASFVRTALGPMRTRLCEPEPEPPYLRSNSLSSACTFPPSCVLKRKRDEKAFCSGPGTWRRRYQVHKRLSKKQSTAAAIVVDRVITSVWVTYMIPMATGLCDSKE